MTGRRGAPSPARDSIVLSVRAKPRSPVSDLQPDGSGGWIARLRASPVDGKANDELVALVAKRFGRPRSSVSVISGESGRRKLVAVSGLRTAKKSG